jgi:hypothetical protein
MNMKREDVVLAAQMLTSMKSAAAKLEKALKQNDSDTIAIAKKEILELQSQLATLI